MHIHFIGIGGIGTSALAKYYLASGHTISGSDLAQSEITDALERGGAAITIGKHKKKHIPEETDRVIMTSAVPKINPERKEAKQRGIALQTYPEAVGEITQKYKTITISGAHGKSTTTALTALVLEEGYHDPTVIIGTKLREFGNSNFRQGRGSYLVLEADEWNRSFLNYSPHIAVVTNIDAEHLDTYKTVSAVGQAFAEYLARVPQNGKIIANADDPRLREIGKKFRKQVVWYSLKDPEAQIVRKILSIPGEHNVSNALAALHAGRLLGVAEPAILHALSEYRGSWRRFEWEGMFSGAYLYSDYGHHPNEIKATIAATRERFPYRRVWCVYQPHQHRRLAYLFDEFTSAFDMADRVCLLPVYDVAGRETKTAREKANSVKLAHAVQKRGKHCWHSHSLDAGQKYIEQNIRPGDVVLMMGAGDIYGMTKTLMNSAAHSVG
ncbi:MAG: UDP-N-acetylmuramate--L-alanine ligase [Candidatus Sungbacteria bacterium]|nr:UDP-N-acetylmuramate--L-alanine ligase [Candidatus Sungbacteria bacterium]